MDHMRISGTEPSSPVVGYPEPNKVFKKMKSYAQKVPKQARAKRDGVITHKKLPKVYGVECFKEH